MVRNPRFFVVPLSSLGPITWKYEINGTKTCILEEIFEPKYSTMCSLFLHRSYYWKSPRFWKGFTFFWMNIYNPNYYPWLWQCWSWKKLLGTSVGQKKCVLSAHIYLEFGSANCLSGICHNVQILEVIRDAALVIIFYCVCKPNHWYV